MIDGTTGIVIPKSEFIKYKPLSMNNTPLVICREAQMTNHEN